LEINLLNKALIPELTEDEILAVQLRHWQMLINEELKRKKFRIPIHLGLGTEAVAAAVSAAMASGDKLLLTHRNIAYNLARSRNPKAVVDEYEMKASGMASGRLGSMNLSNPEAGVVYSSSILANNISVSCGFAYAQKIAADRSITFALTGDGAIEEGAFYEGLVFARASRLPLMVIIDNNNYSMASKISERRNEIDFEKLCLSIGIKFLGLDGNSIPDYVSALKDAKNDLLENDRPVLVEVKTSLLNQHAGATPGWPGDPMKVEISNGLIIAEDMTDPIYVIKKKYGYKLFNDIEAKEMSENYGLKLDE